MARLKDRMCSGWAKPWLDSAPLDFATIPWPSLVRQVRDNIRSLGWIVSTDGAGITRIDSGGHLRNFSVGFDNFEVLLAWLRDVHRHEAFRGCGRAHSDSSTLSVEHGRLGVDIFHEDTAKK